MDIELRNHYRLIANDCTAREWANFVRHINAMSQRELDALADWFGWTRGLPARDYLRDLSYQTWRDAIWAYERVTRRTYQAAY